MAGAVIELVPKRLLDFAQLEIGDTQDVVLADRIDLTRWAGVTLLSRIHSHSLSSGAGTISIRALPMGHTQEEPGLQFIGSQGPAAETEVGSSTPSPGYLTAIASGIGPMARIVARGVRETSGDLDATVSVAMSLNDTALALGPPQYGTVSLGGPTTRQVSISATDEWAAQPSGTDYYIGDVGGSLSYSTTSGVITYSGPTRPFLLVANVTIDKVGTDPYFLEVKPVKNSELVGTTGNTSHSQGARVTPGSEQTITARRITTLSSGDTVRAACRNTGSNADIKFRLFTLTVEALAS